MLDLTDINLKKAVQALDKAKHITAFTGAGISIESGVPPFRGEGGLWTKEDPKILEMNFFKSSPAESWKVIKKVFFNYFSEAKPNAAHLALAEMETHNKLNAVITQNIDNLHQEAGNKTVIEFHGNAQILSCMDCGEKVHASDGILQTIPPKCSKCNGVLRPDFIFFGEPIPQDAYSLSVKEAENADVFILIGTSGVVVPAALIPQHAKQNGVTIIEINPERTAYTDSITDIFLKGKAGEIMSKIVELLF
ncbi:MAG: NAD-dependent deacylase [Bacteroidota bacterium]|nr:NAD-dependent deacylase [Bacteroidota bacterium]